MNTLTNPIDQSQLEKLRTTAGNGPVLILTHDNPDPDGLASGKALSTLLREAWDIPSQLIYSGLVARAENHVMLDRLTPDLSRGDSEELPEMQRAQRKLDPTLGAVVVDRRRAVVKAREADAQPATSRQRHREVQRFVHRDDQRHRGRRQPDMIAGREAVDVVVMQRRHVRRQSGAAPSRVGLHRPMVAPHQTTAPVGKCMA